MTRPTLLPGARIIAGLATTIALAACAAPQHRVAAAPDLLESPAGSQTLTQELLRDRCLAPGQASNSSSRCEAVRDLIAPQPLPVPQKPPKDSRDD